MTTEIAVLPTQLSAELIGKVISVQAFLYSGTKAEGQIDADSLKKWVGILRFYSQEDDVLTLVFDGMHKPLYIDTQQRYFEVYTLPTAPSTQLVPVPFK